MFWSHRREFSPRLEDRPYHAVAILQRCGFDVHTSRFIFQIGLSNLSDIRLSAFYTFYGLDGCPMALYLVRKTSLCDGVDLRLQTLPDLLSVAEEPSVIGSRIDILEKELSFGLNKVICDDSDCRMRV